jgi:hypothetical protein
VRNAVARSTKGYLESGSVREFDDPHLGKLVGLLKGYEPERIMLYLASVSFIWVLTMLLKSSKLEGKDLLSTGVTAWICSNTLIEDAGYDGYFI